MGPAAARRHLCRLSAASARARGLATTAHPASGPVPVVDVLPVQRADRPPTAGAGQSALLADRRRSALGGPRAAGPATATGRPADQWLWPDRRDHVQLLLSHPQAAAGRAAFDSHRSSHCQHPSLCARRQPRAGARRCRRRTLRGRRRSGSRLPQPGRPDRRAVRSQSLRRAGIASVPDRGPSPLARTASSSFLAGWTIRSNCVASASSRQRSRRCWPSIRP